MNLEQRVMALEQEVELLKAQIQTTLLDIQEQMLNQAYPVLRGDEPSRTASLAAAPEVTAPPMASPIQKIRLAEPTAEPTAEPAAFENDDNAVPDVSMFRRLVPTEEPPPAFEWAEPTANTREANPYDWIELESWVSQKVEKLGIERTRELIRLYAQQERFSEQERDLLMQFVDIYEGAERPSLPKTAAPKPKFPNGNGSIVPQTRAVVAEIREELRQNQGAAHTQTENSIEKLSDQQGLMLRLIAGILNAGDDSPPASGTGAKKR
jgi:hypothetical protein